VTGHDYRGDKDEVGTALRVRCDEIAAMLGALFRQAYSLLIVGLPLFTSASFFRGVPRAWSSFPASSASSPSQRGEYSGKTSPGD
jgi:hypothetical protein